MNIIEVNPAPQICLSSKAKLLQGVGSYGFGTLTLNLLAIHSFCVRGWLSVVLG